MGKNPDAPLALTVYQIQCGDGSLRPLDTILK